MAACGAAVEAAYWAKKNNLKVTLVDKAAMDRSGAVAMGLSAINQYIGVAEGDNTVEDYVHYVRQDLMGVTREDLVYNIARHVDSTVHLFEKWGLPIWKDENGKYVHEGRWQVMINGESYKVLVAEAAKNALGTDNIYRARLHYRAHRSTATKSSASWASPLAKTSSTSSRPRLSSSPSAAQSRLPSPLRRRRHGPLLVPALQFRLLGLHDPQGRRRNDLPGSPLHPRPLQRRYGPVGAWFLLFKSAATNAFGENYMVTACRRAQEVRSLRPRQAHPATCATTWA